MALELTQRFLKKEKEFLIEQTEPVFIESLERELRAELIVDVFGEKKKINLSIVMAEVSMYYLQVRLKLSL